MNGEAESTGKSDREAGSGESELPLALLLYTDLMFGVQLQNIARKSGYRVTNLRANSLPPTADVLVVDLSARAEWEEAIRQAHRQGITVVAFGPHMDAAARRKAKAAGASRVLTNSNLARDLPTFLKKLRKVQVVKPGGE